jgi:hypothetical protein
MNEWNQDSMPKRMQQSIKATREKLKQEQRAEIKKSAPVEPVQRLDTTVLVTQRPMKRATKPKLPKTTRVAAVSTFPSRTVLTHKRRRWLKKHPGVPVNQYPQLVHGSLEERRSA